MKIDSNLPPFFPNDYHKTPEGKQPNTKTPDEKQPNDPYDLDLVIEEAPDHGPESKELTRTGNTCQCNVSMSCACTSSCSGCCARTRTCNGCR